MNFKDNETATKLRGGYYTPPEIARFLLEWVLKSNPGRILEPSCGDGAFIRALSTLDTNYVTNFVGFELDLEEAEKSKSATNLLTGIESQIYNRDFLGWALTQFMAGSQFDAVIGNPPFIRYQYLDSWLQDLSQQIFQFFHLPFTKHTNAWVPFVISSLALLRPGGRLAMVLPSEILHVLHAQSLRTFLAQQCSKILLFDPEELWFTNTLQGAVILFAEKKTVDKKPEGLGIVATTQQNFLHQNPENFFQETTYTNGETIEGKWMWSLLTERERMLLKTAVHRQHVHKFDEIAEVAVGIVTGANKFFLVPDDTVEKYELQQWAFPMFGRSGHVQGVIYDDEMHRSNRHRGLPTNFLWFQDDPFETLPIKAQIYLEYGKSQNLHQRYKCRIRKPWYSVPSVYATSVGMLKRCHDFPRLIFNELEAYTTDTAYRIQASKIDPQSLVFSFINSLTALSAEIEGRHYGGGVLELVPSEIRQLIVPIVPTHNGELHELNKNIQQNLGSEKLLFIQDKQILASLGFSDEECETLRSGWNRLRNRRQRNAS